MHIKSQKSKVKNGISIITAVVFFVASSAYGQTDSLKEQKMQPVEVRAIRAVDKAPFAKTDISSKEIEQQNLGQDLPVLLQYTPSSVTTSDAGTGVGYTGIRIRGTDATRINVTMNGIPVNDPEEQAAFFVDVPDIASSTSSIQIQRGVGTSTNGAGAFGATIGIYNLQQMDTAGAIFSSSVGSFNTWKNTLHAGTGLLKGGFQFDVRLSKITSEGYIQRGTSDLKSMQLNAGWKINGKTNLHFMVMTGVEKTGQAWGGVPPDSLVEYHPEVSADARRYNALGQKADGTYYNNQTDNYQQDYYQLFADHQFKPNLMGHVGLFMTRGRGYYEEYVMEDHLANYGITGLANDSTALIRQKWLDNYYYGGIFSLLWQRAHSSYTIGGGLTQFENLHYGIIKWTSNGGVPDNYEWYRNDAQKNDLNIYLKSQHEISKRLSVFLELQSRMISYFINGYDDNPGIRPNVNYNFFNPKGGITYQLKNTAEEKQKIYASVAVAHREANRADFEADSVSLPKPEELTDIEAGYEIRRMKWSVGLNAYYMSYKDQLVLTGKVNDVGAYTQTNVPNSYRAGIELQGAIKPNRWFSANANATLSQNKIKEFTEYIDNYDNGSQNATLHNNTNISFSPGLICAAVFNFKPFQQRGWRHLEASVAFKYVGEQFLDNTMSVSSVSILEFKNTSRSIPAYGYCNLLLRYSIKPRGLNELTFTAAVNNIFNSYYSNNGYTYSYIASNALITSNYYFPQAGRNVLAGIILKL